MAGHFIQFEHGQAQIAVTGASTGARPVTIHPRSFEVTRHEAGRVTIEATSTLGMDEVTLTLDTNAAERLASVLDAEWRTKYEPAPTAAEGGKLPKPGQVGAPL